MQRGWTALALALLFLIGPMGCRSDDESLLEQRPYLGMWCPRTSAAKCDRLGIAVRLQRPTGTIAATVAGRPVRLMPATPGASGHYWYGFVRRSDLEPRRHVEVTIQIHRHRWRHAVSVREGATRRTPPARVDDGRWRVLPAVPAVRGRGHGVLGAVRVGRHVVVALGAGYEAPRVAALSFDRWTNRWTRPSRGPLRWRSGAAVVAARGRVFVLEGASNAANLPGDGATYDPARRRWRLLEPSRALARTSHSTIWTGSRLVLWGGQAGRGPPLASGSAYDPRRRRWSSIGRAPLLGRSNHTALWTGERMIVWGGQIDAVQDDYATYVSDGAAYDPARDRWERIAPAPIRSNNRTRAVWAGSRMIVWTGAEGATYDPATDRWRRLPRAPMKAREGLQSAVSAGGRMLVWGGMIRGTLGQRDGAAYDPRRNRWSRLRSAPIRGRDGHAAAPLGNGMLVWGGCCRGSTLQLGDGAIYTPR